MNPTLDLEKLELKRGSHAAQSQEMCIMEAVAYVAEERWSDSPQCASPVIAAFLRSYNDSVSDDVRQTLKQYIPILIGTHGSDALENRRSLIAADWLVRIHIPAWLRLAGLTVQAEALESLPEIISMENIPSIKVPLEVARQAAADTGAAAAKVGAETAAWDGTRIAAWNAIAAAAGDAAWTAAGDAAWTAAWTAAWAAAWAAAWTAGGAALKPIVYKLQATIPDLIARMVSVTE